MKVKINKELVRAANFNPTKESRQVSVYDLCQMIEKKDITIPLYQRDLSWSVQKYVSLLNYQLLGKSPVSPISINVIKEKKREVPQVSFLDRDVIEDVKPGQYSVVDGQQRLSTNYKAYINHPDFKKIVLDLGKVEFIENTQALRDNQIPAGILLNKDNQVLIDFIRNSKKLSDPTVMTLLLQINSKIRNYNYTINSANDLTEDEQINWFEVLNNAGSRVSVIQMAFSKLKSHGIDIYKDYTNLYTKQITANGYDFFTPQTTNVSYPIAALNPALEYILRQSHQNNFCPMPSDTKENKICALKPEEIRECFEITLENLDKVLDFIDENDLERPSRIDYINYLLGFFVFHETPFSEELTKKLINWYNTTNFTNKSNSMRREIYSNLLSL